MISESTRFHVLQPDPGVTGGATLDWPNLVAESAGGSMDPLEGDRLARGLRTQFDEAIKAVLVMAAGKLTHPPADPESFAEETAKRIPSRFQSGSARAISLSMFTLLPDENLVNEVAGRAIRKIGIAPSTQVVLDHLDWCKTHFQEVVLADNFRGGEIHGGLEILQVDEFLAGAGTLDAILLATNNPDIEADYLSRLPKDKIISISELGYPSDLRRFSRFGHARAERILAEIEASGNPLIVLGQRLMATTEPTFLALEQAGFDVFALSLFDKLENQGKTGYDPICPIKRNAILTIFELLYILTRLRKGVLWVYYDFFYNTGWDAANSLVTYAYAAATLLMASRPVVLGMYDILKPIYKNMECRHDAFAVYKVMLDQASAVVLTSKSDHIAEYLRNTLVKDRPVFSFYRYSLPPSEPLDRLSDKDGERHLVGVTSFLGEVFEPNRVETRNSIRSILRQKIHFHYYSSDRKVFAFQDDLSVEEKDYFHIEPPIWDQCKLVRDMSRFDGGWLVGDESTIFARLIGQIEDRHIRELFSLFVPNGVPTSSMAYGAAGLPVFISRQIKVMDEVFPKRCCIPLDMGEVDNLATIFEKLDWKTIHHTMRAQANRFDAFHQIPRLAAFLDSIPRSAHRLEEIESF